MTDPTPALWYNPTRDTQEPVSQDLWDDIYARYMRVSREKEKKAGGLSVSDRLEPMVNETSSERALTSIAISLKRLVDLVEIEKEK